MIRPQIIYKYFNVVKSLNVFSKTGANVKFILTYKCAELACY